MDIFENSQTGLEIAVIGMAGRFPKAKNIDEFWNNLKNGVECISFFTHRDLEEAGIEPDLLKNPNYIKARAILEDIEYFDSSFFGYIPVEAELMDPQVRIFHECAWEALEDAGYVPGTSRGRIGLYAGAAIHTGWQLLSLLSGKADALGNFAAWQLYDKDFMATRISYNLNLSGPSVNVHTACSTSLVAIHLACQGLLSGECRMALAGGVTTSIPVKKGYLYEEGMIVSRDGHCRAFDAKASGTVFGEGAGVVVLKPLEKAIADGDYVQAVIKSTAINNDGRDKVGYQAPSIKGQAQVIHTALRLARVGPESIAYVETHGTGTNLGDPTEIEALKKAFNTDKKGFCRIGAVKSNVGHLDIAAGAAGFIKTVLMLKHKQIPPSLYFETPNPKIDFDNSPFIVNTELIEWKRNGYPLRAGVSSFGVGGTNAHVILEEAPPLESSSASRKYQLLLFSAKTGTALDKMTGNLSECLNNNPGMKLADAAYTLQTGRQAFTHRRMWVGENSDEAAAALANADSPSFHTYRVKTDSDNRPVIFMFSGQGSQYVNMGLDLYRTEPLFREEMNRCFAVLRPLMGYDIKEILFPSPVSSVAKNIDQTEIAQPVLFIIEYALAKLLMQWGIKPYAMIGHSIGEYTAACAAGVFSLEHALEMVVLRGRLMQRMPPGDMLSVSLAEGDLISLLEENESVSLAAVNTPGFCVVSGSHDAIDHFSKKLKETGHEIRLLHTSHAFHSAMMDPILKEFEEKISKVTFNKPRIPYISNITGKWITAEDAANSAYWARHIRQTVKFSRGLEELLKNEDAVLLEVGPGKALATFARQHPGKKESHTIFDLVRHPKQNEPDQRFLLDKIGQLWLCGVKIDWKGFYADEKRFRVPLPTYPFERRHYPIAGNPVTMGAEILAKGAPIRSLEKNKDISQWFYIPLWEKSLPPVPAPVPTVLNWLVFADNHGMGTLGSRLMEKLEQEGQRYQVIKVNTGPGFTRKNDREFIINPGQEDDYNRLFKELRNLKKIPHKILHLWGVTGNGNKERAAGIEEVSVDRVLETGFYSLLHIARAIGNQQITGDIRVGVVTDNMQEVLGTEALCPEKATVLGAVKVIPAEYPNIRCCCIDIEIPEPGSPLEGNLSDDLLAEFVTDVSDQVIAYRGTHRWVQVIKPVPIGPPGETAPRLKEKGVYLITGGLGGIGLTLAGYLAERVNARLVLTGRSPFPAREEWEEWFVTHAPTSPISRKIQKLLEIEQQGGEVLVLAANAGDREQMQAAVDLAGERFGPIDGVIHAAGLPDGGLIQARTREMSEKVFESKVKGTLVLENIFRDKPLDIFVLCSSLSSLVGPLGQAAYTAANAFLDAYASHKIQVNDGRLTTSIGWDGWQEVGMAVEAVRKLTPSSTPSREAAEVVEVSYPLFDYRMERGANETIYVSHFRVDQHWVLDEHRLLGKPTLPGTACLEMARAALEDHTGNQYIEILEIYFLTPFRMEEEKEKEVHTVLKKEGDRYQFIIRSPVDWAAGEDRWVEHARGEMAAAEPRPAKKYDIDEMIERCNEEKIIVTREMLEANGGEDRLNFVFGPRWKNVKEVHLGSHQVLLVLELDEEFSGDIGVYKLHPALLDTAAGYLGRGNEKVEGSLPFSYRGVKVRGALTRRMYSYQEYEAESKEKKKLVKYSITLLDEQGVELVDIEEYKRLTVSETAKTRLEQETEKGGEEGILRHGILPAEGIEVFSRILGRKLPWVVVSTKDFTSLLEAGKTSKAVDIPDELEMGKPAGQLRPRPGISKPYAAPTSTLEKKITEIWQNFLGIEQIGIHDDFFELGGDSLKVMTISSKIHKTMDVEIPLGEFFNHPTPAGIAGYIAKAKKVKYSGIELVEEKEYYPLSSAQKRLFALNRLAPDSTVYNLPEVIGVMEERFQRITVEKIFKELIKRHESLRTSFHIAADQPVQKIHDSMDFKVEYYELTVDNQWSKVIGGEDSPDSPGDIINNFVRPFDLSQPPLIRTGLIKLPDNRHIWMVDMHHIAADGTSLVIFAEDFALLYPGTGELLPELRIQYKDFTGWQNHLFESGEIKAQEDYWLDLYRDAREIPRLNLAADYIRPDVFTFTGDYYGFMLGRDNTIKFKELGFANGATLYMNILAVLNVLFYKYTGQTDIIIGSGIAGRPHADLQRILGMFVNTLAMRNYPEGDKTFEFFLREVVVNSVNALENQDLQFEELVDKLELEREPSRNPLFDISMVVQNTQKVSESVELPFADKTLSSFDDRYRTKTTKFDITFFIFELTEDIYISIEYYTAVFKKETIERLAAHFNNIIKAVTEESSIKLKEIEIISREEKNQIIYEFNNTAKAYPEEKTIHELFEDQVEKTPDHSVLVYNDEILTYKELFRNANQLAHYLYYEKDIQPGNEVPVGILMSQSLYQAISILGILKVGGVYVPIDPLLPQERIKYIITDACLGTIISGKEFVKILNRLQWECKCFHTYLCIDSDDIHGEDEIEKSPLMNKELWHHVAETAVDEITGGGWISSYTGEPFSKAEMDEYGDNILKKLEPLLYPGMRVLEIGCASGISMYRIAPKVGMYYGTDLSKTIIDRNKKRIEKEGHRNIKLSCLAAHEIDRINGKNFNLVIMNSVIQCFHGHNYLRKIIRKSIDLLGEKGYLFIGDIMDQEKKDLLVRELAAFKNANRNKDYTTKSDLSSELFISKEFWKDICAELKEIEKIEFSDKIFTIENELTKFRYDTIITINKQGALVKRKKKKFQDDRGILFTRPAFGSTTPHLNVPSGNLAYIIYTSGTTGKPKGVEVEHRSVINTLLYRKDEYRMNPAYVSLQLFSYSFDGFVASFFTPIISGVKLVLLDREDTRDVEKIRDMVVKNRVTHFISVPALYSALNESLTAGEISSLVSVTLAGDKVNPGILKSAIDKSNSLEIVNEYGVTESSVMSTIYRHQEQDKIIKIGHPIWNTRLYILDDEGRLQPIGVAGELCISGVGLARGYLNRPGLTAEKFDHDLWDFQDSHDEKKYQKFLRGSRGQFFQKEPPGRRRLYKTGDMARWLGDGNIEIIGRVDQQVKIRGFRIELAEIETRLLEHDTVKETVVVAKDDENNNKYICAYIVFTDEAANAKISDTSELKEYLSETLPDYMIPAYFVSLEEIPLTANGKIHKKALPEPDLGILEEGYEPPGNRVEEILVETWQDILGIGRIGINDNFFEVGGDSIKAIQAAARLKNYGMEFKISDLFLYPTIKQVSQYVRRTKRIIHQGIVEGEVELTPIQRWFFQADFAHTHHFNQAVMLYCNNKNGFDAEILEKVFAKIVEHHDALRMVYEVDTHKHANAVIQENRGIEGTEGRLFDFEILYFEGNDDDIEKKIENESTRIQGGIDLKTGPLVKVGLFKTYKGDHLLIVIHHLVVDGISWRILLEDFAAGYQQLVQGKEIKFQEKTDSFQYWARKLKEYAGAQNNVEGGSLDVLKELGYWKAVDAVKVEHLPADRNTGIDSEKNKYYETVFVNLDEEETELLLRKVNWAYNTEINDILLTALGMGLKQWAGLEKALINLEGHGRESIIEDVDITRTVGWFTTQYPVILDMTQWKNLSYAIKSVKENLKRIPNKGIGYGILRYLTPDEKKEGYLFEREAEISFYYLGEFKLDTDTVPQPGKEVSKSFFKTSWISTGQSISQEWERRFTIEINGIAADGQMRLSFTYNTHVYRRERIEQLADNFKSNLLKIIEHCSKKEEKELTPGDMMYSDLSIEELQEFESEFSNIEE